MKRSESFERQVARIHTLIKQKGSKVTWDDRIPDPDNPIQLRQIDITITRDTLLTIIECRIHKKKQDVKWIEELIGRRSSLNADTVIAVSASGFTKGAISKAKSYGIILRDFISLSEEEIIEWGSKTKVALEYIHFIEIFLGFSIKDKNVNIDKLKSFLQLNSKIINDICKMLADKFENKFPNKTYAEMSGSLKIKAEKRIQNININNVVFKSVLKKERQFLSMPSVVSYDDPGIPLEERTIFVENFNLGEFQITKSRKNATFAVDLTKIPQRNNCLFRQLFFDFGEKVTMDHVEFFGKSNMDFVLSNLKISILP